MIMLKKYPSFIKFLSTALSDVSTIWLFFALALGLFVRAYFLSQPMRGDESYTFLTYVNGSVRSIFDYSIPNNHLLNTLLIKLSTFLFGGSPATIRFPAFIAGLAVVVVLFYFSRSFEKTSHSGIFAAVTAALFPYLIFYSTNARGYALVVAFSLVIAWVGQRLVVYPSNWGMFWLALFSALGMAAIPIMLFSLAGIALWLLVLLLLKHTPLNIVLRQFVLPYGILSGIFTAIFYIPVLILNGLTPIISNKLVEPQAWDAFLAAIIPELQKSFDELVRDVPTAALLLIFILAALGIVSAIRMRNWSLLLILPCLLLGAAIILFIQRVIPYARAWIYLIPFTLLLADAGLVFFLKPLPGRIQVTIHTIILIIGLFFAVNLTAKNAIIMDATDDFPEAAMAAQYLKPIFKPGDSLRISPSADLPVYFYFWYYGMSSVLYDPAPSTDRVFFVRKKSRGPMGDAALQKLTLLLDMGNMAIYQGKK